jgi:alpha-beta hydrolase superfamily lysophospholipase
MNRGAIRPGATRWTCSGLALALSLAACGSENTPTGATATTTPAVVAIHSEETAAPQGVVVAGAQWIQITGAGGRSDNVQVAAVHRPPGNALAPLIVWLHGAGPGFVSAEASAAARLAAGGFVVLVGCWTDSAAEPVIRAGVSIPRVPCLKNFATADEATEALVEAGKQLAGVKKGPFGLLGVSAGGTQATRFRAGRTGAGAIVLDSAGRGQTTVDAPILILGGTADTLVSVDEQRTYEQALRDSGTTVEAHYYEGGGHGVTVVGEFQEDAFKRIIDFYLRYLK